MHMRNETFDLNLLFDCDVVGKLLFDYKNIIVVFFYWHFDEEPIA